MSVSEWKSESRATARYLKGEEDNHKVIIDTGGRLTHKRKFFAIECRNNKKWTLFFLFSIETLGLFASLPFISVFCFRHITYSLGEIACMPSWAEVFAWSVTCRSHGFVVLEKVRRQCFLVCYVLVFKLWSSFLMLVMLLCSFGRRKFAFTWVWRTWRGHKSILLRSFELFVIRVMLKVDLK